MQSCVHMHTALWRTASSYRGQCICCHHKKSPSKIQAQSHQPCFVVQVLCDDLQPQAETR